MTLPRRVETGMATAELAVAIPALVVVLAVGLGAVRLGVDRVRVVDAAHVAARLAARGEPPARAQAAALAAAPDGASVHTSTAGEQVRVVVVAPPPAVLRLVGLHSPSRGAATARLEGGGAAP